MARKNKNILNVLIQLPGGVGVADIFPVFPLNSYGLGLLFFSMKVRRTF
ncbi:hypothetical protein SAMN05216233_10288 [Desulfoluna spongiiphila]|uniref:Uncharacterized protein n=1 Tax=Desulfoluna spongiiphila TaxID=419481 RepID=A0A1G5BLZ9_9BACT|nr:hypothetical protein SAMN05216233_10288 [Desulfoluna spongiiphila]